MYFVFALIYTDVYSFLLFAPLTLLDCLFIIALYYYQITIATTTITTSASSQQLFQLEKILCVSFTLSYAHFLPHQLLCCLVVVTLYLPIQTSQRLLLLLSCSFALSFSVRSVTTLHGCLHIYMHTSIQAYAHTYMHMYLPYTHAHIYTPRVCFAIILFIYLCSCFTYSTTSKYMTNFICTYVCLCIICLEVVQPFECAVYIHMYFFRLVFQ